MPVRAIRTTPSACALASTASAQRKTGGASVDLGLAYDAKRDLVWGVLCNLQGTGALNVLRFDGKKLALQGVP